MSVREEDVEESNRDQLQLVVGVEGPFQKLLPAKGAPHPEKILTQGGLQAPGH